MDSAGDRWAVQLSSASLLLPSYYKFSQVWLKKLTSKLELHIKNLIIIPIFFSFTFSFFFGLNRTHTTSSSPVFKVREYKVIRTLDTNERKKHVQRHVLSFTISLGDKVYIIPAHQSAQAFLANHKNFPQSQSHWSNFHQNSGFLCLDLEYNS